MLSFLLLASLLAISHASPRGGLPLPIHRLKPRFGSGDHLKTGMTCDSWRLAIETNNIRNWFTPAECQNYVRNYMLVNPSRFAHLNRFGHRYLADSRVVTEEAALYAQTYNLIGDGKDIWVFDIDETVLSLAEVILGLWPKEYTDDDFDFDFGPVPALPGSLKLYDKLLSLGIKVVFLTGREEQMRNYTETNLKDVGYHTWEKLILRGPTQTEDAIVYKSYERMKLENKGYRIIGNMGDQWSDISGTNVGGRIFKLPNPMYYVA